MGAEGLRWFVRPSAVLRAGRHEQYSAFAFATHFSFVIGASETAVEFFVVFVSFGPEFAPAVHVQLFLIPYSLSMYFVALGEVCPGASFAALLQSVPGTRPVSISTLVLML